MKTSIIEARDMLSVLSVQGVEKRIGEVPGVESVTVNYAAGNATVRYDETRLDIADIKAGVRQGGYEADNRSTTALAHDREEGHPSPEAHPSTSAPATPTGSPIPSPGAPARASAVTQQDSSAPKPGADSSAPPSAAGNKPKALPD
ncbi:MAG: cation transporter [Gammaproteobacteria bacterium]